MCKELCEIREDGEMSSCQDCGRLICFDIKTPDDICRPAYVTESGDVYCDQCGRAQQRADMADDDGWEEYMDDLAREEFDDEN